jgi:rod shape-determining protein MreC
LVLAVFESFGALKPVKSGIQQVTIPIQAAFFQARRNVNNVITTVGEIGGLRSENIQLAEENAVLTAENQRLVELATENKALREQLGITSQKTQNLIAAKTIGFSPLVSKKMLLVDKGEVNGVKKGFLVVIKNILIGQIYEVTPMSSSVQLISDPDSRIPSVTSKKVRGVTVGQFGAEIELTEVVQGESLNVGDLVLTTGEGGYAEGLVLGKINEVKKVEKELFQKATIAPLVSLDDLSTVFIVSEK